MYGTIARIKLQAGSLPRLQAITSQVSDEIRLRQNGHIATYLYQSESDPEEVFLVVMWENKELYFKNANSPEQNEQFNELARLFAEPPQWHDGEIVWSHDSRLD